MAVPTPCRNGRYAWSRSRGRQASSGVSRVTTRTLNPDAPARLNRLRVTSRSLAQYSWNQRSASPIASATCSMGVLEADDRTNGTPCAAAARAAAGSASGCRIDSTPTGASASGAGRVRPSTSTDRSRAWTSRSMRGTIRRRSRAARLARAVLPLPALPVT
ncbi:hypothetical protein TNCT6_00980 [Streptomyces sp. 6-11-2]|nr:hypothetical protein TNCT6_00980 [Streptomyces sp. 6-11-2]